LICITAHRPHDEIHDLKTLNSLESQLLSNVAQLTVNQAHESDCTPKQDLVSAKRIFKSFTALLG
jgi:hypothetical protein